MHVESFKPEHLERIKSTIGESFIACIKGNIVQADKEGKMIGFSLIDGDKIIAIGGICDLWDGVGDAFSVMSDVATKYPKSLYSAFSNNIEAGSLKYRRVQAMVRSDFEAGIRFIERLKFSREGLMRAWGIDGFDYYMYARVK